MTDHWAIDSVIEEEVERIFTVPGKRCQTIDDEVFWQAEISY